MEFTQHLSVPKPQYPDPADIMRINEGSDIFDDWAKQVDERLSFAISKEPFINFPPAVIAATATGNFNYSAQSGQYKKIDDLIYYEFYVVVTNFLTSGADGAIGITTPAPVVGAAIYSPVVLTGQTNRTGLIGFAISSSGKIATIHLNAESINSLFSAYIIGNTLLISGSMLYRYK